MIEEQQAEAREASVGGLIRSVADDAVLLVRTEAQLAISEARLAVAGMRAGGVLLAVAGALLFAAVIILLVALSFLLRPLVGAGWAELMVAALAILGALLLARHGLSRIGAASRQPRLAGRALGKLMDRGTDGE